MRAFHNEPCELLRTAARLLARGNDVPGGHRGARRQQPHTRQRQLAEPFAGGAEPAHVHDRRYLAPAEVDGLLDEFLHMIKRRVADHGRAAINWPAPRQEVSLHEIVELAALDYVASERGV